jgi:hypothetical protein
MRENRREDESNRDQRSTGKSALHGIPFLMRSSSGFDLISHIQRVEASAIMAISRACSIFGL